MRDHVRFATWPRGTRDLQTRVLDNVRGRDRRGGPVSQRPPSILFDTDGYRLVPAAIEMFHDRRGRGNRHFVLAGTASVNHTDSELFHGSY
jgi:hypothetical protein